MRRGAIVVLAGLAALLAALPRPARADEQPFLTLYTSQTEPQGELDLEQTFGWRAGHPGTSFNEFEARSELEYGLTKRFQLSLYFNYDWTREKPPASPADVESFPGASAEFIYAVSDPRQAPLGLAFYLEPSISAHERGIEFRILLEKDLLGGALRNVANVNFEDTWEKDPAGHWARTSALEFDLGTAYAVAPHWTLGVEFDNERGFDGLIMGGAAREASSAFFLGPTIQYDCEDIVVTFGAQTQLPVASVGDTVNGYAADAEHFRLALRLTREL